METGNFLITAVGGQGTILASDIVAAVGLAAGYNVRNPTFWFLLYEVALRSGTYAGGDQVHSTILREGRVHYLPAFEILGCLRWLNQACPEGRVVVNLQEVHPVMVSSGLAAYPDEKTLDKALQAAASNVYRAPGLDIAQKPGSARLLNTVLVGALSGLVPVSPELCDTVRKAPVPPRSVDLNLLAFRHGRNWLQERSPRHEDLRHQPEHVREHHSSHPARVGKDQTCRHRVDRGEP